MLSILTLRPGARASSGRRALAASLLAFVILAPALAGCGAGDVDAPYSTARTDCPRLDEQLAPIFGLVEDGKLLHLQTVMSGGVPDYVVKGVVEVLFDLVGALPDGTLAGLVPVASDLFGPEAELEPALGALVRFLAVDGDQAPYGDLIAAGRGALNSCDGPPILYLAADIVEDTALLDAAAQALSDPTLAAALGALRGGDSEAGDGAAGDGSGREAVRLLIRNLMVSAKSPDFDATTLTALLDLIVDTGSPPWSTLVDAMERLLAPGSNLDAIQGLLSCMLAVDPDASVGPFLYDLLTADGLGLVSLATGLLDAATDGPGGADAVSITSVIAGSLRFIAGDDRARRSLASALTEVLRPDVAVGVLEDVADLFQAQALGAVVTVLADMAAGACSP